MTDNALTGIADNYRTPGHFAEIEFAQGPSSAAAGEREVVFVMPKTSSGTWDVNKLYSVSNSADAESGGGAGSMVHRGIRKFMAANKDARVSAVVYSASSGAGAVAAATDLTIATTATGTGTLSVWVAGERCDYTFNSGDTVTAIGDGIEAVINARTWLPVTASNSAGTVTITAKIAGISQGTATLGVIRLREEITSGVGTTATLGGAFVGADTAGVDGATTEAANFQTALAVLDSVRKYYIVSSVNDATSMGHLKTHITTKSEPKRGLRSRGVFGYPGSLATGQTLATGRNYERLHIAWQPNSEHDSAELAGYLAAALQKGEGADLSHNFNGQSTDGHILAGALVSDWADDDDIEDALTDGLTPIHSNDSGAFIVQSVTTRSKDSAGTLDDARASRSLKVSVADGFVDTVLVRFGQRYGQKKFRDDERKADGTINHNQRVIRNVVRPSMIRGTVTEVVDEFDFAGHLQEVEAIKSSISIAKSKTNPGRAVLGMELHVVDWFDQSTLRVAEVSQG